MTGARWVLTEGGVGLDLGLKDEEEVMVLEEDA